MTTDSELQAENPAGYATLSVREKEIFQLLCRGRSLRFISGALNISENTVKTHTRSIYNKLDIHSRQELITLMEVKHQKFFIASHLLKHR